MSETESIEAKIFAEMSDDAKVAYDLLTQKFGDPELLENGRTVLRRWIWSSKTGQIGLSWWEGEITFLVIAWHDEAFAHVNQMRTVEEFLAYASVDDFLDVTRPLPAQKSQDLTT